MRLKRVGTYIPQWAGTGTTSRWAAILLQLGALQIIGFQGTKQAPHLLQSPDTQVFSEHIKNYNLFHWKFGKPPFSNSSTGVSIAIRRDVASKRAIDTFSPPDEVCGRAGAVTVYEGNSTLGVASLYVLVSGTNKEKSVITTSQTDARGVCQQSQRACKSYARGSVLYSAQAVRKT